MQTKEWNLDDKSKYRYQDGPWMTEPDKMQWQDEKTGFPCLIVRNHAGALCGYVGVSKSHPCHGKHYRDKLVENLECHGGLTFANSCSEKICHEVEQGEDDNIWWFGFDCLHSCDFGPNFTIPRLIPRLMEDSYRDIPYVKKEVEHLAKQLKSLEKGEK